MACPPSLVTELLPSLDWERDLTLWLDLPSLVTELLPSLDWESDLQRLNAARALGSARYLRQLSELHAQTRQALADTALCWAAQVPFSLPLTRRLTEHVRKAKVGPMWAWAWSAARGGLGDGQAGGRLDVNN